jgi:hypothetical protein
MLSYLLMAMSVVALASAQRAPIPERVAVLLAKLNQTEKLWQLLRPDYSSSLSATGAGMLEFNAVVEGAKDACDVASNRNAIVQAFLASGPGAAYGLVPAFRLLATHGGEAFGTVFPQGPSQGATFDPALVRAIASVMALEGV